MRVCVGRAGGLVAVGVGCADGNPCSAAVALSNL